METPSDPQTAAALWRYGTISELLQGCSLHLTLAERLKITSQRTWNHPERGLIRLSADTLRHWIYRYKKGGLVALKDRARKDKGESQVPKALAHALAELRAQHPHATTERLLDLMIEAQTWNAVRPSRSALYRFVAAQGLKRRRPGAAVEGEGEARAFAFDAFGDMWVSDFLHGPKVREGRYLRKTYLLAILDDATRYVVYAGFSFTEGVPALIDGLSLAVRRFGIPARYYTDNGPAFRSRHLALVAGRLGMHLPHTPAYRPQGRGKVERFFRRVRDQFLSTREEKAESMEALQRDFATWLEGYHKSLHEGLNCSPLNKRLQSQRVTRSLPEVAQLDLFFGMSERRRVHKNGTIHLLGQVFDVKGARSGERVEVHYLPWDLSQIHIGRDRMPAKPLNLLQNAHRFTHNPIRGKDRTP